MLCRRRNGADVGQGPDLHRSFQTELARTMRTTKDRIRHLVLFEVTALVADIALVVFYVVFAFVYNLAYDHIFPIPEGKAKPADGSAGR